MRTAALGVFGEAVSAAVDRERVSAYIEATNDSHPAYRAGAVPPLFACVLAAPALEAAVRDVIDHSALAMLVHASQDAFFTRLPVAGETLETRANLFNIRVTRMGTAFCFRSFTNDAEGRSVLDVYSTCLIRGLAGVAPVGPDAPDHSLPREARAENDKVGGLALPVDDDQSIRYATASGDQNPIHLDRETARRVGLPDVILHGMCTLAMCGQAVFALSGEDPERLRRIAARFVRPVFLGSELMVSAYKLGFGQPGRAVGFEASSRRKAVILDGRAEFAAARNGGAE
jgi:acyl dehydratase